MISNSEKLCRLLGISPKNNKYPDLTEPYNFVKIMTLALEGQSLGTLFINYKIKSIVQKIKCFFEFHKYRILYDGSCHCIFCNHIEKYGEIYQEQITKH